MIRLTTLGEIDLRLPDGERATSVLHRPGQFALLVYLALADGALVRRDTLLGLFWPDSPEDRARHRLSQAVYELRQVIGKRVIVGRGASGYGVDTDRITCDAARFRAALARGDAQAAVELYTGDFLPGFFAENADGFERWMEEGRGELRRCATQAAMEMARMKAATDPMGAAAAARRALDLSWADEPTVREVIELLYDAGDRVGALQAFETLEERLDRDYGTEPSRETRELVRRIRTANRAPAGAPARAAASGPARPAAASGAPAAASVASAQPTAPRSAPEPEAAHGPWAFLLRQRWPLVAGLGVVALAGVILLQSWATPAASSAPPRVFVDMVANHPDLGSGMDLSRAVTTETLARLAEVATFEVLRYDPGAPPTAGAGPAVILRADLARSGDQLRVTALLLDAESMVTVAKGASEHPVSDDLETADAMAAWLSRFARERAGSWLKDRKMHGSGASEGTVELVRAGIADRARSDSLVRVGAMDAAARVLGIADSVLARAEHDAPSWAEPSIQRAETALAEMWLGLRTGEDQAGTPRSAVIRGIAHADRALSLAPQDLDALATRGGLAYWDWQTTPSDSVDAGLEAGRDAEMRLREVVERDPTRARAWADLSALLQARGAWADARWAGERAFRADAYLDATGAITARLFETSLETGDLPAARVWCGRFGERNPGSALEGYCRLSILAWTAGDGEDLMAQAAEVLDALRPGALDDPVWGPRMRALESVVLARAGFEQRARDAMELAVERAMDPEFAPFQAWALLHLDAAEAARVVLERYVGERPHTRSGVLESRRFRELSLDGSVLVTPGPVG